MKIWLVFLALIVSGCAEWERYPEGCWEYGYHYPSSISNEPPPLPKAPGGSDDEPSSVATKEAPVLQKEPPREETLRNMCNVRMCEFRRRYCSGDCRCTPDGNLYRYYPRYYPWR